MLIRSLVTMLLATAAVVAGGSPAAADVAPAGSDTLVAQTIAGVELTVAVRRTGQVPGPLRVDVIPHTPVRDLLIDISVRSATSPAVAAGSVRLEKHEARTYPIVLVVHGTGPHWLELRAGGELSQLPFRVERPRVADSAQWVSGAFAAAALLLVAALATAAWGPRTIPVLLGGTGAVALVAGTTIAVLAPATMPAGDRAQGAGRSYAQARIVTVPRHPVPGAGFTLRVTLVEGSSGRPLDDLVPHHQAFAHVVVTSADGSDFHHLHPRRTGAGRLEVGLSASRPGPYRVDVELVREGSGSQLVSGGFDVAGPAAAATTSPDVLPTVPARPIATRPVSIEVDVGPGRVQPWLGMAGHLIVRDSRGGFLGHAHEMGSMAVEGPPPDDTVAAYSPRLRFAFTFPEPGRYFVWLQYSRGLSIATIPYVVDVEAVGA